MGYSKKDVQSIEQPVRTGDKSITGLLDGTTTVQTITFGDVFSKVTFQASGDLAGNVTFSVDGINFKDTTAIGASNAMISFSTHNVCAARVTRTGGSGKVSFACK